MFYFVRFKLQGDDAVQEARVEDWNPDDVRRYMFARYHDLAEIFSIEACLPTAERRACRAALILKGGKLIVADSDTPITTTTRGVAGGDITLHSETGLYLIDAPKCPICHVPGRRRCHFDLCPLGRDEYGCGYCGGENHFPEECKATPEEIERYQRELDEETSEIIQDELTQELAELDSAGGLFAIDAAVTRVRNHLRELGADPAIIGALRPLFAEMLDCTHHTHDDLGAEPRLEQLIEQLQEALDLREIADAVREDKTK